MEEESQKMMALKKAYAEIILNTAKEAAARVMLSERKAHESHHDLSSTKDEALRLLLRLKQTMEWKINEAEMKSHDQQVKIDELEAQLQEAEDIVTNLRAELNETNMKLDELAYNQKSASSNAMVNVFTENGFNENTQPVIREATNSYGYCGEPEVPSIISRRKERELYINGCTQRIRACDGNHLKDKEQSPSTNSLNLDGKLLDTREGLSSTQKDRILKHTFQRKRRIESVISDDRSPLREKIAKKQNGNLEHEKPSEVTES